MRNIVELICRRFPTIVWIALIVFMMAAAATYTATPMYTSEARITIPPGQESTLPTTALTTPLYVSITRAEQIQTQIEVLRGRNLVEKTIDALPDALFEPDARPEQTGFVADLRKRVGGVARQARAVLRDVLEKTRIRPRMSERDAFILSCAARLDVNRRRETDVIGLSFRDSSPEVAQIFLTKFLEIYVREKSTTESSAAVPFFAEQEQKLRNDLVDARKALGDFRREWGILDLASQRDALLMEDARILSELNQAQAELVQIEVSLTSFREAGGHEAPESVLPSRVREDQGMAEALRNLATLRARESRLWTEMGESHPDLANIRTEITRLRAHVRSEGESMLNSRANILKSLLSELKSQRSGIHDQILTLESKSREMLTLETEVSVLETALSQYAERRETSRMSVAIEAQQINAINVVEPPSLAYSPSSPVVPLNLMFGLVFGVSLGLAYVFFHNRFSSTILTPEDLRNSFSNALPAAQLPDMLYPRPQGFIRRLLPIPRFNAFSKPEAVARKMPGNAVTMLGRKFFYPNNERRIPRSLMLTGAGERGGATACALLLAEHLRKAYGCRVLLVDTRFDRRKKGSAGQGGDARDFASWLRNGTLPETEDAVEAVEVTETVGAAAEQTGQTLRTGQAGVVDALPAGTIDDAAQSAVFALTREKLDVLRDGRDVVVFDAEPVLRSSTALHLAALVDDVILVARSEVTRREVLSSIRNAVEEAGGAIGGAICNFRRFYIPGWVYRLIK